MLTSPRLRGFLRRPGTVLAFALSFSFAASAQFTPTYSPALPIAGNPVTITIPGAPYPDQSIGILVSGSKTGAGGGSFQVPVVNGNSTLVTPPLPADTYLVTIYSYGAYQQTYTFYNTLTVYGPGASDLPALNGQYAFQLSGEAANTPTAASAVAVAGSFTADGQGNITSGVLDINSPAGVYASLPATGTYQLNAYGIGSVTLNTPAGSFPFTLATKQLFSGTPGFSSSGSDLGLPARPSLSSAVLSTNIGGLVSASGPLVLTSIVSNAGGSSIYPDYTQTLSGSYLTSFSGAQGSSATPLSGVGQFTFATNGTVTASSTISANGGSFSTGTLTGTYTPFSLTTGRSVLTLSSGPGSNAPSQTFAVYQIENSPLNNPSFFFLSITPRTQDGYLSGRGEQPLAQP